MFPATFMDVYLNSGEVIPFNRAGVNNAIIWYAPNNSASVA